MKEDLRAALCHEQVNYWVGLPCGKCYPQYRRDQLRLVRNDYEYLTHAVVLSNRNYVRVREEFPAAVGDRPVWWIGGEDQDITKLHELYPNLVHHLRLQKTNAYEAWINNP